MSICPVERLDRIETHRKLARKSGEIMKNGATPDERSTASRWYVDNVDALLAELNALADAGTLDEIRKFLEVSYGRAD